MYDESKQVTSYKELYDLAWVDQNREKYDSRGLGYLERTKKGKTEHTIFVGRQEIGRSGLRK